MNNLFTDARELLISMGFDFEDTDTALLSHTLLLATERVLSETNLSELPENLNDAVVSIATGEFLLRREYKDDGRLKSISEGDVSVTYSDVREELLHRMINGFESRIARSRRLPWG